MNAKQQPTGLFVSALVMAISLTSNGLEAGQMKDLPVHYKVLAPITQRNLTIYPVVADRVFNTSNFLTLDEGIRSGQVIITEAGETTGLVRPRPPLRHRGVWDEHPWPAPPPIETGARVNELALVNNSDRPLLLLAGEIVTGGKQDRIVGKDRIVPAHGKPVELGVFCVEPHRWTGMSMQFGSLPASMAQPSVRSRAMADQNQQEVWDAVSQSRQAFAAVAPRDAREIAATSSYAKAVQNDGVKRQLDSMAVPLERSYDRLIQQLRANRAVGVVVAVNGELIWADVFASPELLEKYWPKLIRSYAAEAITPRIAPTIVMSPPSAEDALRFLDRLNANHENVETEPGVYRNTEMSGDDFEAFLLTSLLPNTGFEVHIAKMKR
jgi:hypothetical protein